MFATSSVATALAATTTAAVSAISARTVTTITPSVDVSKKKKSHNKNFVSIFAN